MSDEKTVETPEVDDEKVSAAVAAKENELLKRMNEERQASEAAWREERQREREELMALLKQGGGESQQPKAKPETNPFDPDSEPVQWAKWEAQNSAKAAVTELTEKTLKPIADQLMKELNDVREAGWSYTKEKLNSDPFYQRFEADVKKELKALSPQQQSDPRVIKKVLDYVKGTKMDEILEEERQKSLNATEGVSQTARPKLDDGTVITPRVEKLAAKFGMEPKEYAEQLKAQGVDPASV